IGVENVSAWWKWLMVIVAPRSLSGVDLVRFAHVGVLVRGRGGGWWPAGQEQCGDESGRDQAGGDPERAAERAGQGGCKVKVLPPRQRRDLLEVGVLARCLGGDGALQEDGKKGRADGT